MRVRVNQGSAHVVIVVALVLAIIAALGIVVFKNFIAKQPESAVPSNGANDSDSRVRANTIEDIPGTDMKRYTNYTLGFYFDFPKQTYGDSGCHATDEWYDNNGVMVKAPVTSYIVESGTVDMTVLESKNVFTVTQKSAPKFTIATYGADQRQYNSDCKMVTVTPDAIDDDTKSYVATDHRSWQVYKIDSLQQIADKARSELKTLPNGSNVASVQYKLGGLTDSRQQVTYEFTYKDPNSIIGGGATKTWYYPNKQLLVHVGLGQSQSFAKPNNTEEFYMDEIVNSFKVLE